MASSGADLSAWLPAATAMVGGGFALLGVRLGGRNEASKWRREKRLEVYTTALSESDVWLLDVMQRCEEVAASGVLEPAVEQPIRFRVTAALGILGPDEVQLAAVKRSQSIEGVEAAVRKWIRETEPPFRPHRQNLLYVEYAKKAQATDETRKAFIRACRQALGTQLPK